MDSNVIKQHLRVFRIITLTVVLIAGLSFAGLVTSFMFRPQPLTILLPHHISAPYQMSYSSANRTYLSDTLGAEINHITISTQEQIRQIALETVQFGNVIAIILPFIFLGLLLGIGRVAGSVTSTVFRGDRPVYEGETPTSYNR